MCKFSKSQYLFPLIGNDKFQPSYLLCILWELITISCDNLKKKKQLRIKFLFCFYIYFREIFPYLVVIIGIENVVVITKSVVSTSIELDVKYRVASGKDFVV